MPMFLVNFMMSIFQIASPADNPNLAELKLLLPHSMLGVGHKSNAVFEHMSRAAWQSSLRRLRLEDEINFPRLSERFLFSVRRELS